MTPEQQKRLLVWDYFLSRYGIKVRLAVFCPLPWAAELEATTTALLGQAAATVWAAEQQSNLVDPRCVCGHLRSEHAPEEGECRAACPCGHFGKALDP